MANIRIISSQDKKSPTVQRFLQYQLAEWDFYRQQFFVVTVDSVGDIARVAELLSNLGPLPNGQMHEIWPSLSVLSLCTKVCDIRSSSSLPFAFRFYLNSIAGLESSLEKLLPFLYPQDLFIVNSNFAKSFLLSSLPMLNGRQVILRPVSIPHELYSGSHAKSFVSIFARPNRYKLIHTAVEAFSLLGTSDLRLAICLLPDNSDSSRYYTDSILKYCERNQLNVVFMYDLSHKEVYGQMQASFCTLVLSTTFEETQGKVIVESASNYSLPIANHWNGFVESLLVHDLIVPTLYSEVSGLYVSPSHLSLIMRRVIDFYHSDLVRYKATCDEISGSYGQADLIDTPICKRPVKTNDPNTHYQDLVYRFTHGTLDLDWDNSALYSGSKFLDVDTYLARRVTLNHRHPGSTTLLLSDYHWLCANWYRPYAWHAVLGPILETCLTNNSWSVDDLRLIRNYVKQSGLYKAWLEIIDLLFPL